MREIDTIKIAKFLLFAFPCYWSLALIFIATGIWKVSLSDPDLMAVIWLTGVIIAAAFLLAKKLFWVSFPMILLGAYIMLMLKEDQHFGVLGQLYGIYIIVHYLLCGIYVFKKSKEL